MRRLTRPEGGEGSVEVFVKAFRCESSQMRPYMVRYGLTFLLAEGRDGSVSRSTVPSSKPVRVNCCRGRKSELKAACEEWYCRGRVSFPVSS